MNLFNIYHQHECYILLKIVFKELLELKVSIYLHVQDFSRSLNDCLKY